MTGYARGGDGDTPEPPYIQSPYQNRMRIVNFCNTNGYFCHDYWSQDTYEYETDTYNPDESANANEQHHQYCQTHIEGQDWFPCRDYESGSIRYPAHTDDNDEYAQHLTGNRRAYAAWWLWARIAGWDVTNK